MTYGLGIEEHDKEGRVITAEMEDFYLVTVYTPNSQSELRRLEYRMEWERDFLAYLLKLQEKKPVICCGDMHVARQEIDLQDPEDQSDECRLHRRGACLLYQSAGSWIYRYLPLSLPGSGGRVFLAVLSFQRLGRRTPDGESTILLRLHR